MNANLIAAIIAGFAFTSIAHAEQTFGRDSVYAGKSTASRQAKAEPAIERQGRDSVYVTNSHAPRQAVKVGNYSFKHGRA